MKTRLRNAVNVSLTRDIEIETRPLGISVAAFVRSAVASTPSMFVHSHERNKRRNRQLEDLSD
jgi:hypothetical protein